MKIVFINRYFWPDESATAQLLSDLAFALARRGHEVTVLAGRTGYRSPTTLFPKAETQHGVTVIRRGGARQGRASIFAKIADFSSFLFCSLPELRRLSKEADWIVSLTDPPMLSFFTDISARRGCRRATWCMDIFPEIAALHSGNPAIRLTGRVLRYFRNRAFRHQQALIALGDDMGRHLSAQELPRARLRVIPNWSVSSFEEPPVDLPTALRKRLSIPERFTVGYSGNLGRVHEPYTVAEVIRSLPEGWDGQFLFFSFGRNLELLRRHVADCPGDRTLFLEPLPRAELESGLKIPDVHWFSLYPHFSKLVFPSKFSGILAAGKPCLFVGDPACEIARLIGQFQCGTTIEPGDSNGFYQQINTLRKDPELRAAMGSAARRLYDEVFTRDRALQSWAALLESHP